MGSEPVNVKEFQEIAQRILPKMYYDFYAGGAEDQHTLKENEKEYSRIIIRPRILLDVSRIDMSTTVLGHRISSPIMIAPTAMHKLAHPEGEIATAKAAAASKTIMVLSFSATCSIEEVASSCNADRFFQLYVFKRRDISRQLVQRAERSGYKAIVVTVDTPRLGRREADIKNNNQMVMSATDELNVLLCFVPTRMISPQFKNLEGLVSTEISPEAGSGPEALALEAFDQSLNWKDIDWLKSITKLPILIKGVLTREDAIKAMEVGVDGIIVSNHGARQLDYSPATIFALEEITTAVNGRMPILFDGGIRRGTDIFKALALGAQAVLVGRPVIFALAAKGEQGVKQVIKMLKDELELTMALAGCRTIKEITRNHVRTRGELHQSML